MVNFMCNLYDSILSTQKMSPDLKGLLLSETEGKIKMYGLTSRTGNALYVADERNTNSLEI